MRVLLLGGTADGRELAEVLLAAGHEVVESLAGRTKQARGAADALVGGFGGAAGLAGYLRASDTDAVVDATHPFAEQMTRNAAVACTETGVPLLRFTRPGWSQHAYASDWLWVDDHAAAARAATGVTGFDKLNRGYAGPHLLLTVGRQPLPAYHALVNVVARVAEWQNSPVPDGWQIIEARGPFTLRDELDLMRRAQISCLVSKDSGGSQTAAKLDAAHQLGVQVIMVGRPGLPSGITEVATVAEVVSWLDVRRQ